ncbi:MAG: aminotransferase class V-fold PLP-dependent enzyme [Actinobacteria bacterium]|nr:aminotransferase class V-fold PLP-dependent enzyme [Actinomycetota bacterium]
MDDHDVLHEIVAHAERFLDGLPERPVGSTATVDELWTALNGPLPMEGLDDRTVVTDLMKSAESGLVATAGPRFFGFVIGGSTPASLAADWLTTLWDQNAGLVAAGPAAAVVEEIAGEWLKELLALPKDASFAMVTGCQMANFVGMLAARHQVLTDHGWNVEADGLQGSPTIAVVAGEERHATMDRALRFAGLGAPKVLVPADDQGRMRADALRDAVAGIDGPMIVCAQAGNVNTGAFDPLDEICDITHARGGWVHVDAAFGLWAAVSPRLMHLLKGHDKADSWATDAHKWLNVPYDSGLVFCAHPKTHRASTGISASYLLKSAAREEMEYTPESSRRARAFPIYAAVRALGRAGIVEMVERCCDLALRFADQLSAQPDVDVLNDVVLNQVLVRFGDDDERTRRVIDNVQRDGTCWLGGSTWKGQAVMRISLSNWSTTAEDVDRSVEAIIRAARAVGG